MADDAPARIKPPRAEYKTIPTPSPNVGNGTDTFTVGSKEVEQGTSRVRIKSIERDDSSTSLIDAVNTVYRVVTARIAYHEREAAKLREALKPFGSLAPRSTDSEAAAIGDSLRGLLDLADRLNVTGEAHD